MATTKRKKKQGSPFTFIFMAIFAYLAGFPSWIVLILGLVGFLLWQVQKAQQGSKNLPPLPPAEPDEQEVEWREMPPPTEAASTRSTPEKLVPAPQTYRDPLPKATPPPWSQADYQAYPSGTASAQPATAGLPRPASRQPAGMHSGAYRLNTRLHPLARNLQTRDGARQAIIAMTVLGPSRSAQPYEFDPIQQGDVAPPRSS